MDIHQSYYSLMRCITALYNKGALSRRAYDRHSRILLRTYHAAIAEVG